MMRRLLIILLLLTPMTVNADLTRIDEIAVMEGSITRVILGDNTTVIPIQNFEYLPGWLLYLEYTLTTNASSYFTDITYANTMTYRTQSGTVISAIPRVELTNNSYSNGIYDLTLLGEDKLSVYLQAEIFPDTRFASEIVLDYRLIILERNEMITLDETREYSGEINHYPSSLDFKSSYIGSNREDIIILMPEYRAKNESRLPENYHYIMDIIIEFTVEIQDLESAKLTFSIPPYSEEEKIQVLETGTYEITLNNMDNREIQRLNIYHDGSDLTLTINSVRVDIPALIDVPQDLIIPVSIKISSSFVALILFLLSYKIVDTYGKRKLISKSEELY